MSDTMQQYRALEEQLAAVRETHPGGSPEEDAILDRMDPVWYALSDSERSILNTEEVV